MAAERKRGLYGALASPWLYEAVQRVMGAETLRRHFADAHIRVAPGARVLDIGCGPADLLAHLPAVTYIGWEPNPLYVERARARFGDRATFHVGLFGAAEAARLEPVDVAIVSGVLHHMDDAQARTLFGLLHSVLKPGGRVVSVDPARVPGQHPLSRLAVSRDRGRHVRAPGAYLALARDMFPAASGTVAHQAFPPYTRFFMTAPRAA